MEEMKYPYVVDNNGDRTPLCQSCVYIDKKVSGLPCCDCRALDSKRPNNYHSERRGY